MVVDEKGEMEAACHCGTVRFRVKLTDGFNTARRCTCSYCRMRGAVAVSADVGDITFDAGEEGLTGLSVQHRHGATLFLFEMRHPHPPSPPFQSQPVRCQRRLPERREPV
jgi:hypothetical protein